MLQRRGDWASWYAQQAAAALPAPGRGHRGADPAGHPPGGGGGRTGSPSLAGPPEPPSRIHGDCWSGNVLWSGGRGWLIDPAAQGGHRETDLAMLALFGAPYLDRILAAYSDVAPLAAGWRDRVPLHQLHPLLVHACLFGSGYAEVGAGRRPRRPGRGLRQLPGSALQARRFRDEDLADRDRRRGRPGRLPPGPGAARASVAAPRPAQVVRLIDVVRRSSTGSSRCASGASGSVIRNVAPSPGAVFSATVPPCAATSAATMARPRPVPPAFLVRAWSAR